MSLAYRNRKKRIKRLKRTLPAESMEGPHIKRSVFRQLQADWEREITGPPIGTLEDFVRGRL